LPEIELELLAEHTEAPDGAFLRLVRRSYRARYADGQQSAPFDYDAVDRAALDAVVIAAHYEDEAHGTMVFLRSCLRPPLVLRAGRFGVSRAPATGLWELPAGLVEPLDETTEGVRRTAQRELLEELGFDVPLDRLEALGPSTYPAPGFTAERQHFFSVAVIAAARRTPTLDGSVLEQGGVVVALPLSAALTLCDRGAIEDAKSELGLRRLKDLLT
jgi:ADP-ribose pyrophosphatase